MSAFGDHDHGELVGISFDDPFRAQEYVVAVTGLASKEKLRLRDVVQDAPGVPLEQQPGVRQPQVARRAFDQRRADAVLQPRERPADRGFGQAERPCGSGYAAKIRDTREDAKLGEIEHDGHRSRSGTPRPVPAG